MAARHFGHVLLLAATAAGCASSNSGGGLGSGDSGAPGSSGGSSTATSATNMIATSGSANSGGASSPLSSTTTGESSGVDGGGNSAGGSTSSSSSAPTGDGGSDSSAPSGTNAVSIVVNNGPPAAGGSVDVPFVSVTVCAPGSSTNCATIDYVSIDTGSSGLRLIASALPSGFTLPQVNDSAGAPLGECFSFGDGTTWGSVRSADVKVGGEIAKGIPIQLIGDPAFAAAPKSCSSFGLEDTIEEFGGNGLIGINQIIPDCGSSCGSSSNPDVPAYYTCTGSACSVVGVTNAKQISNPIASFEQDNNGALLDFPAVAAGGAASVSGTLVFGIGTASDNALGGAAVQTVDDNGNFTTTFDGMTLDQSYVDSGTNAFAFNDSAIAQCTGQLAGWYCPTSPLNLSATNKGLNGVTAMVSFVVENTQTLFDTNDTAYGDLATTGENGSFAWGFPFFLGRKVFVALDGASTPGGTGPYVAY